MSRLHLRPRSSAATAPLDDEDLLPEILLRLPPQPSSLPRASAVCKFWRSLASDPGFSRRFRAHHCRNPPLLGCLLSDFRHVHFRPTLDPPNSISQARFSFPVLLAANRFQILGCRHGLVLFLDNPVAVGKQTQLLVWDPFTGDQHRLDIPPGFGMEETFFSDGRMDETSIGAAVLRAPGDIHHFQVVLVSNRYMQKNTQAVASVYSSATGVWGNPISTPLPPENLPIMVSMARPAVMVGGSFYWLLKFEGILEFDLDKQSLALIPLPMAVENAGGIIDGQIMVVLAEGGGLGLLYLIDFCAHVWKRETDGKGVSSWVLGTSIDLKKLLPFNPSDLDMDYPLAVGFAEENNVMLLSTCASVFTVQFESLQFKKLFESSLYYNYYPFEAVYTADRGIGGGRYGAKLLHNT